MKEISLRTQRNFMQQATFEIMSTDAYGISMDTFSEAAQKKIESLAQKMADDYNLVAKLHNDLAKGIECSDSGCIDFYIQSLIKENISDPQVFFEVTNSYTPHGLYYILENASERLRSSML